MDILKKLLNEVLYFHRDFLWDLMAWLAHTPQFCEQIWV